MCDETLFYSSGQLLIGAGLPACKALNASRFAAPVILVVMVFEALTTAARYVEISLGIATSRSVLRITYQSVCASSLKASRFIFATALVFKTLRSFALPSAS